MFVLLYVKHSSRHVLSEHFTPSVAEPKYMEIMEHLTHPGAALCRWLEYMCREAPVVCYWVGTSYDYAPLSMTSCRRGDILVPRSCGLADSRISDACSQLPNPDTVSARNGVGWAYADVHPVYLP